ncbi:unnamed protein product [Caenorhabditis sp. 36 PRJEB53466]|nr:unnamed protein product [Caenorhabditis sp. 36 PRJEB53466]
MRLPIALLLLSLLVLAASDPVKSQNKEKTLAAAKAKKVNSLTDKENDQSITVAELEENAGVAEDNDEDEEEAEEPPRKKKTGKQAKDESKSDKKSEKPSKKNKKKITEEVNAESVEDDDVNEYEACNRDTSGDSELCHCDMEEINCSSVILDAEEPKLHTMDLLIKKKGFIPYTANFSDNAIVRLLRGKILPGNEEHISILDISYNQVRFADSDVFTPFTNLTKLNLAHNNLQTIKKPVFESVKKTLHRLDLSYNRIKVLPDNVFEGLTNLKVLVLDGNPIKVWRKEIFTGLDSLEELSLDNCNLDDLPADLFEFLPKLVGVSLRQNPLEEIPTVVANLKTLKDVDMSETNITEIRDHAFAGDSDLEEIILEKMPYLSVIRDCGFCGLPKLKILYLNDNSKLMEIHPNAFGFIKSEPGHKAAAINDFAIHNSNVSTISEHMLDYDKLDSFKIGGNPWNCDCDTQFLLQEQFTFKQDSIAPKCAYPEELKDHHLATVRVTDACEGARFLGRSGRFSSVLGLALLVIFICLGLFYMYSSGKLARLVRQVRKEPEVCYTNLQAAGEDYALETDFQPRPAEV